MSLTTMTELWRLSATDLVEAIRSRQTSSQEVIEAHLRRIEAVNPSINAVTVVLGEHPLQAAKAADRAVAGGSRADRSNIRSPCRGCHGRSSNRDGQPAVDAATTVRSSPKPLVVSEGSW